MSKTAKVSFKAGKTRKLKKADMVPIVWANDDDINDTGSEPVEFRCVIRLDPAEEKTIGGIIIPDDRKDRSQMAATRATLLACGGNAFQDWKGLIPAPGDRIEVSKYAGVTREADPTDLVRIIQDKEILAVLT